jgi:hypothetical protein
VIQAARERDGSDCKAKLAKFVAEVGITDADVQAETGGKCITVAEYIELLIEEYVEQP